MYNPHQSAYSQGGGAYNNGYAHPSGPGAPYATEPPSEPFHPHTPYPQRQDYDMAHHPTNMADNGYRGEPDYRDTILEEEEDAPVPISKEYDSRFAPTSTGEHRKSLWQENNRLHRRPSSAGGCLRWTCCCLMVSLLLFLGIVSTLVMYIRPPSLVVGGLQLSANPVQVNANGFAIQSSLLIAISNPNYFGADIRNIDAQVLYKVPNQKAASLGGGALDNVKIKSMDNTTIDFPFALNYTISADPNQAIIRDIATRCGFLGQAKRNLVFDYTIKVAVRLAGVTVNPSFDSSASLECPLEKDQILRFLGNALGGEGGGLGDIAGAVGGLTARSEDSSTDDPDAS